MNLPPTEVDGIPHEKLHAICSVPRSHYFKDQHAKGFGFAKSMISTYKAVLSSPGFLFVEETPGKLDPYALATRLTSFLWNSEPGERLRDLAQRGEISDPETSRAETERLLDDPKARRFVEAFTD